MKLPAAAPRRPPWPPQLLLDLAAGRGPGPIVVTPELLALAAEHRMTGLLWSAVRDQPAVDATTVHLASADLRNQANLVRLRCLLETCVVQLREQGIEVASVKGPITEDRWYGRAGERPCVDIDLWLSPGQMDRAGDALATLQPDHPWLPFFGELAHRREVDTVTLKVDGMEVDLHLDLLKTGLPMRTADTIWSRTEWYELPGGIGVRVLDPTAALFHFLVHLNKDRFQRLLGYADVVRILGDGAEWPEVMALAESEGLGSFVAQTMSVVVEDLSVPAGETGKVDRSWRDAVWSVLWRRRIRLRGTEGRQRFRWRQLAIAMAAQHHPHGERLDLLHRELFPPEEILTAQGRGSASRRVWELATRRQKSGASDRASNEERIEEGVGGRQDSPV